MRLAQPTSEATHLPYSALKLQGCSNLVVGFDILSEQPTVSRRRYCNKVLVHECVSVPAISPVELERVEFIATDDNCYKYFNIFKSSNSVESETPTIELQLDDDDKVIGVLISFTSDETSCLPLRMAYHLNGYDADGGKILLSQGNLFVSPGGCDSTACPATWTDVSW